MVSLLPSAAMYPGNLLELSELPENRYPLPSAPTKVNVFKGSEFNVSELAQQLKKSNSFSRLFEKSKLDSTIKRPLLPLNVGQVGLIGGSGLINGVVECDTPHILKGRIVKEITTRAEENLDNQGRLISTTLYEVRSNKLIFNLLTPQGFISLAEYTSGSSDTGTDSSKFNSVSKTSVRSKSISPDRNNNAIPLGSVVVTANARSILTDFDISSALLRHQSGDWGDILSEADMRANNSAVKNGDRILSAYKSTDGEKFWIITECDRSYTTILMPEDY
jgi:hypothetical protein